MMSCFHQIGADSVTTASVFGLKVYQALLNFTEWLNSLSNSIKFIVKYSEIHLEALDISLFIINGRTESKV